MAKILATNFGFASDLFVRVLVMIDQQWMLVVWQQREPIIIKTKRYKDGFGSGDHFTNDFSILIKPNRKLELV